MNLYRLAGDISHVIAIFIILLKFCKTRSTDGISGKSQILFALTYTLRYMDLWGYFIWISYYNTFLKVFYIGISYLIVYLIYSTFRKSYNWDADSFRLELLLIPVTVLAYLINHENSISEVSWTWSIYCEAVALVPQLFLIWKAGKSDPYVMVYVLFMGLYRGMYILNWVYRYNTENYYDAIAVTSGIIETFVALFGFLCVVSQALAHLSNRSMANNINKSVYVIPLISGGISGDDDISKQKSMGKYNSHLPL